ncbi:hypothetical protein F867_gp071 [Staphylococcus phage JD007]|uniref:Uncharacterized protein n=1 Tax=Staphylococcus phage JD007 TaxID=1239383 RepID=K7QMM4_9CAUD|nr:hypothetical protein F867_gp071 [Staphylococcus phage JD007]AFV50781.1 hypothetical protein [Staphylococcus phage JD007]
MKEQIKQFERELEMAVNNLFVLHDCGATQQELEEQNSKVVYLKAIVENMKAYAEIRVEPKSEKQFFKELEEELEQEEKVWQELMK